ncbi:hypothetical protein HID58_059424 [Brassica napus]|uniref:Uncharacterized protein n=1 Tax=Brassica napus TaxID=3708 RepID=A0ABQ7ZTF6_BRANA|nr:hypothetical protein HID58_059424 [Brassica napus]
MRWRRNIKAFGLVDKTWQQVMDRRRRKLTVKKMMRRMKSRKIHLEKDQQERLGWREKIREVRTRQGDTSIKTADELSKIMAFLFEWCCQFPRTDSFSPVAIYSVRLKSRDFALSTISLS